MLYVENGPRGNYVWAWISLRLRLRPRYQLSSLVVGLSLSLDQRLGIRCRLTSVIRHVVTSLSDVHWKHFCSVSMCVSSALEVFFTTMRYLNRHYLSICLWKTRFCTWTLAVHWRTAFVCTLHGKYIFHSIPTVTWATASDEATEADCIKKVSHMNKLNGRL